MPTRLDPTRTTLLRRQFIRDVRKRFRKLDADVRELVVDLDVFGIGPRLTLSIQVEISRQAWRAQTNPRKVESFRRWLQEQVDAGILEVDAQGNPWTAKYVNSAYRKGTVRAYVDTRKLDPSVGDSFLHGGKEEFLRQAFAQPERLSKIQLLATRAFEELRGVSAAMAQQMNRSLAEGLAAGRHPKVIAREMSKTIRGLSRVRAEAIARTETIRAHAEGQLDAFEDLGVDEVGILAEWSTAGDDRVCPQCEELEGQLLTVQEARGLIPRHVNCLPGDSLVSASGRISAMSKRRYDGEMVIVRTACDRELICSPNHPILTSHGWLPAHLLDVGSHVIGYRGGERVGTRDNNHENMPTPVKDVAESFFSADGVVSVEMPLASPDFHSDVSVGQIAVIGTDSRLGEGVNIPLLEHLLHPLLVFGVVGCFLLSCLRSFGEFFLRCFASLSGLVSGFRLSFSLSGGHSCPLDLLCFAPSPELHASHDESGLDDPSGHSKVFRDPVDTPSLSEIERANLFDGKVQPLGVVFVGRVPFSGHVYNLQTEQGWYAADGIVTHNCRCSWLPAQEVKKRNRRKNLNAAIKKSLRAEVPSARTLKDARRRSRWVGKEL